MAFKLPGEVAYELDSECALCCGVQRRGQSWSVVRVPKLDAVFWQGVPMHTDAQWVRSGSAVSQAVGDEFVEQQAEGLGTFNVEQDFISLDVPLNMVVFINEAILHMGSVLMGEVGKVDLSRRCVEIEVLVDQSDGLQAQPACG